jgi:GrpB-like predicted nucleotidyltransferase (UPF0157 family)
LRKRLALTESPIRTLLSFIGKSTCFSRVSDRDSAEFHCEIDFFSQFAHLKTPRQSIMLIKKYTADWVKDFEDLKHELEKGLHGINCQIEHIGSTSVPGLDAKAIIDLDIIYESQHHAVLDRITHHLYVCPIGSKALERHILSRDFLRKNEWARQKYQEMKYELAEQAKQDKKTYATLKELHVNTFIDAIIKLEKSGQKTDEKPKN